MKILKTLLLLSIVYMLTYCNENNTDVTNANGAVTPSNPIKSETTDPSAPNDTKKTDGELILEGVNVAIDLGKDLAENKRIKDSIKLANKEKMYGYQLGLPLKEKSEVFELYKKLQDAGITGVYALRNQDEDYVMVQYEAKDQSDLYADLKSFKDSLSEVTTEKIEVINLMEFCGKKDIIKKGEKLTKRKENVEIPCLICD